MELRPVDAFPHKVYFSASPHPACLHNRDRDENGKRIRLLEAPPLPEPLRKLFDAQEKHAKLDESFAPFKGTVALRPPRYTVASSLDADEKKKLREHVYEGDCDPAKTLVVFFVSQVTADGLRTRLPVNEDDNTIDTRAAATYFGLENVDIMIGYSGRDESDPDAVEREKGMMVSTNRVHFVTTPRPRVSKKESGA